MSTPWIRVAAAIIEQNSRYLITRRNEDVHLAGLWEFPGGKCEPGESFEVCLQRELLEELDIEVTPPVFVLSNRHHYPEKNVELHFFSCAIVRGEPKALGCKEFRWVNSIEFGEFEFPPADVPVLQKLTGWAGYGLGNGFL